MFDLLEAFGEESISFPPIQARLNPEYFHVASDTAVVVVESAETLTDAVRMFTDGVDGGAALYLIRGEDVLATYNGEQSEPHREVTYHVTKNALEEWLDALAHIG